MKKRITVLICLLLASVMALMLTSCDGGGSMMDATTTSSSTTASTTESSSTSESSTTSSSTSSTPTPSEPKEYTAKDISDILNNAFTVLSEAMGEGEEDLSGLFELDDISIDNIINNGTDGLGFEKLYIKDGFTYSVSNGDVTIEKEKDGYVAMIGSSLQTVEKLEEESSSMDMSTICIEELDITPNGSKKNSFVIAGDSLASLLNVIAGEELYDSATASALDATLSMTYFATNGNIIITVNNEDGGQLIIGVTYDYYDGVGKVAFSAGTTGMSQVITYTEDAAGAKKLEDVVTYDYSDTEKLVITTVMESKGESYVVPEGTDHKSCDSEIYEISVKQGNKSLVTVKLNAAMIGNTIRGYVDIYRGAGAPDTGMGGVGLMSASSDTRIKGVFDIVTENEEIISAVANFDMEYYLISGEVSLVYNAQDLKEAGKTPVSITVRDNNLTTTIKLDTVSYEAGQGIYTLTITEPDGSLTANVALPAIKNFELTEKEQLYLDRADMYLDNTSRVDTDIKLLGKGAVAYVNEYYEIEPYIVSRSYDGKRCYVTHFYELGNDIYYDIYIELDFETVLYGYPENTGILSSYNVIGPPQSYEDVTNIINMYSHSIYNDTYSYTLESPFVLCVYNEERDCYLYFTLERWVGGADYELSSEPLPDGYFDLPVHSVNMSELEDSIYCFHDVEKAYNSECNEYKCKTCSAKWYSTVAYHEYEKTVITELDSTHAEVVVQKCKNCEKMTVKHTDGDGNVVVTHYTPVTSYYASKYGVEIASTNLVFYGFYFETEGNVFNLPIEIPDLRDALGLTVIGMDRTALVISDLTLDFVLPEGMEFVADGSFDFTELRSLKLPSTLKHFGDNVNIESLTELIIPENVVYFGPTYEFTNAVDIVVNAKNMETFYMPILPDGSTITYNCEKIEMLVFRSYWNEEIVTIPSCVEEFKGLRDNNNIKKVVLPYGIKKIPEGAFERCSGLTELIIPDTVSEIGAKAFSYSGIKTIKILHQNGEIEGTENTILLPDGITAIKDMTFRGCKATTLIIPEGVTEIGNSAFEYSSLVTISFPDSLEKLGDNVFYMCYSIDDSCLVFGDSFKEFGRSIFFGSWYIKNLVIPENVEVFDWSTLEVSRLDSLVVKGNTVFTDVNHTASEVKEVTICTLLEDADSYSKIRASTLNINVTEYKTLSANNGINSCIETINFSGTEQQFIDAGFTNIPDDVTVNYNVVFE